MIKLSKYLHIPVLLENIINTLDIRKNCVYIDATFGSGGYTKAILDTNKTRVIAFDQDINAKFYYKLLDFSIKKRCIFYHKNFSEIDIVNKNINKIMGIVFDLGISSVQLTQYDRGFSFLIDGKLDMRMNLNKKITAYDVINKMSQKQLANILSLYGGEKKSKKISESISNYRKKYLIYSTIQLVKIIKKIVNYNKIHPATKVFQAIRIFINNELNLLKIALLKAIKIVAIGGIICVVSFHSLEDKIAKLVFSKYLINKSFTKHSKKTIRPSNKEIQLNPRSRSAKLRSIKKLY